jgi:hypothetical protein
VIDAFFEFCIPLLDSPTIHYTTSLMKQINKPLLYLIALFSMVATASAQLGVSIRMNQSQILAGENVLVGVTITNSTGNNITLANSGRTPWLDLVVKRGNGEPAASIARADFGPVKIAAGQTMSKTIELSKLYNLRESGTYSVSAIVRAPGTSDSGFVSNRILFTCSNVRADWSQKVGVPGSPGSTREFRIMNFNNNSKSLLYAQVVNDKTGTSLQTLCLGEALLFRKPQAAVDRGQILHVLYLATPEFYVHARIDINGRFLGRELHTRGASGDPRLMTFADGSVKIAGSVMYDPQAAAKAQSKIRKISERPPYTYN